MKYIFFILACFAWSGAFAQLDTDDNTTTEKRHIGRGTHEMPSKSNVFGSGLKSTTSPFDAPKRMLGQPDAMSLEANEDDGKVDMKKASEFITKTIEFEPDYLKDNQEGKIKPEYSKPQDFGTFSTTSKFIIISWRDAQVVDGDRVDIVINGEVIVHNATLLSGYQRIFVDLEKGFTKIEFKALNQGRSGPNTADFKVEAADGTILTHDQWNLLTGVKASLVVVKN